MGRTIEKTSVSTEELQTWCESTTKHFCDIEVDELYNVEPSVDGYDDEHIAQRTVFVAGFSKTRALHNLLNIPERSKDIKLGLGTTGDNNAALLAMWKDENCKEGYSARVISKEDEAILAHYEELVLLRSIIPEATLSKEF